MVELRTRRLHAWDRLDPRLCRILEAIVKKACGTDAASCARWLFLLDGAISYLMSEIPSASGGTPKA